MPAGTERPRSSLALVGNTPTELVEMARAAERAGVTDVAIPDSPLLLRDVYLSCGACLQQTSRLRVQTGVTNPVTRHPSVTASSALSLSELAPGRMVIGIATGDSACWGVGLKPAKIAEMCEYIVALKALLRGEEATWRGASFRGHWPDLDPTLAPPVYVACSGPRVLKAAAQVADGVIIAEMGYTPENIARVHDLIEQGCAEVGRSPEELEVWWSTLVVFADDVESALRMGAGIAGHWLVMGTTEGKGIPDDVVPKLQQLHAETRNLDGYADGERIELVLKQAKQLGVYDWMLERSARLFGTPDDVSKRMDELRTLGVENWYLALGGRAGFAEDVAKLGKLIAQR